MFRKLKFEQNTMDLCLPFVFDISTEHLYYIDSSEGLGILENILPNIILIGIDTETQPSFRSPVRGGTINPTALMQLSCRTTTNDEYVFNIDLIELMTDEVIVNRFNNIISNLFLNKDVTKIGQGLINDFREAYQSYPKCSAFSKVNSILDTNKIYKHLQPNVDYDISLKNLTRIFLNCNLVKSQQMSNWAKRPLSTAQLYYAACDSLVLLRLYDAMCYECMDLFGNTNFNHLLQDINFNIKSMPLNITNEMRVNMSDSNNELVQIPPIRPPETPTHLRFDDQEILESMKSSSSSSSNNSNSNKNRLIKKRNHSVSALNWSTVHSERTCAFPYKRRRCTYSSFSSDDDSSVLSLSSLSSCQDFNGSDCSSLS